VQQAWQKDRNAVGLRPSQKRDHAANGQHKTIPAADTGMMPMRMPARVVRGSSLHLRELGFNQRNRFCGVCEFSQRNR